MAGPIGNIVAAFIGLRVVEKSIDSISGGVDADDSDEEEDY